MVGGILVVAAVLQLAQGTWQRCPPIYKLTGLDVFATSIDEGELRIGYVVKRHEVPDQQLGDRTKTCPEYTDAPVYRGLSLILDKPVTYRGRDVLANTNLIAIPMRFGSADNRMRDVLFKGEPAVPGINTIALKLDAFDVPTDRYRIRVAWELKSGTFLSTRACLDVDVTRDHAELCND